jgi:hypothetical protein
MEQVALDEFVAFAATQSRSLAWHVRVAVLATCWNASRFRLRNSPF